MVAEINVDLGVVRWCGTWAACAEIQRCPGIQKGNPIAVGRVGGGSDPLASGGQGPVRRLHSVEDQRSLSIVR